MLHYSKKRALEKHITTLCLSRCNWKLSKLVLLVAQEGFSHKETFLMTRDVRLETSESLEKSASYSFSFQMSMELILDMEYVF